MTGSGYGDSTPVLTGIGWTDIYKNVSSMQLFPINWIKPRMSFIKHNRNLMFSGIPLK